MSECPCERDKTTDPWCDAAGMCVRTEDEETMTEIIKTYAGQDVGASQCLVTLEGFIGDMFNAELADDSTVDTSDAVTAINGLIWSLERREAEVEKLRAWAEDEQRRTHKAEEDRVNLRSDVERLQAALTAVVADIHEYERMNNLAPNPGRKECWDSVARAVEVLSTST